MTLHEGILTSGGNNTSFQENAPKSLSPVCVEPETLQYA